MAGSLIETLTGDFDASAYKDGYREALQAVIDAKVEGREVVQPSDEQPTSGTVLDLMAALRASVDAAKQGRGEPAQDEPAAAAKALAKKAPAQKSAASKSPAKTAAVKTGPAKKAPAGKAAAKKAPAKQVPADEAQARTTAGRTSKGERKSA